MRISTTCRNRIIRVLAVAFWIAVWQGVSLAVGSEILVASPARTFGALLSLLREGAFYRAVLGSLMRICAGFGMAIRKSQLFFPVSEGVGIVKSLMMFVAAIGRLADVANQNVIAAASEEMLWACAYEFRELLLKNRRDSRKELIKIIKGIVSQAKKKKDYRKILIFLCLKDGLEQITDSYYDQIKKQQLNLFCDD